jgi:hypothetical protein
MSAADAIRGVALEPLERPSSWQSAEPPETYPSGL